jgi:site-specific DNA-methyltransferase (adenine-specific)
MVERFLDGRVVLHCGDCRGVMAALPGDSVDSVVCDPPYHLKFMGKQWDGGDVAFRPETWAAVLRVLKPGGHALAFSGTRTYHRMACAIEDAGFECRDMIAWMYGSGFPKSHNLAAQWSGWGSALKPAIEPVCLARKPLSEGTIAANVLRWGTGALNIDGCRVGTESRWNPPVGNLESIGSSRSVPNGNGQFVEGRWPANVIHDGSDEVVAGFPESDSPAGFSVRKASENTCMSGPNTERYSSNGHGDSGSAARFFYTAKADGDDRLGSRHPTVKPLDLMRWLCRLVTPKGGTVLDPFAGTGTTGEAAFWEGFNAILVEREPEVSGGYSAPHVSGAWRPE